MVDSENGPTPIEAIVKGLRVRSWNPDSDHWGFAMVTEVLHHVHWSRRNGCFFVGADFF